MLKKANLDKYILYFIKSHESTKKIEKLIFALLH
jgi:hypothetical protein